MENKSRKQSSTREGQNALDSFVKRACDIAYKRHGSQTRRDGKTLYIEHVQRVALAMRARGNAHAETVAWLHDVIEDAGPIDWGKEKFPASVEAAVAALTKLHGERYENYIARVAENGLARLVKLADIFDNLADAPTVEQAVKYFRSLPELVFPSDGAPARKRLALKRDDAVKGS